MWGGTFFFYYFSCSRFCFSKLWPPPPAKGSDRPSLGPSFSFFFYLWNEFAVHFCGNFPPACPLCVGVSVSRSWSCSSAKKNHINIKRLLWLLVVLVCRWGGVGKKSPMLRVRECIYIYNTRRVAYARSKMNKHDKLKKRMERYSVVVFFFFYLWWVHEKKRKRNMGNLKMPGPTPSWFSYLFLTLVCCGLCSEPPFFIYWFYRPAHARYGFVWTLYRWYAFT